ncbi:uncharacterized protein BX664DRAFT_319861 [Halteromyces radiatus]|uniref:uncharacterized protein n=1 Tax=Halteromyces radiatus TaxID=101107 RepID=UPI00221EE6BA|nr:uncharacterized protein BX664DRAFT_319861 [Halteromyces radiatus]KAI8098888.1 hypothetical protein BX664DRAFT_319861 [Halteromyces radiatus]
MPNNKRHTLKTVKKREELHPYSRKAQQLSRIMMRKEKLTTRSTMTTKDLLAQRWMWFRFAMDDTLTCTTKDDMHDMISMYLERNDDELEKLQKDRQLTKRPKSSREHLLEATITSEKDEYKSGMELPDLTNGKVVKLLREWDGDTNSMTRIKTIRLHMRTPKAIQDMITDENKSKDIEMKIDDDSLMDTK